METKADVERFHRYTEPDPEMHEGGYGTPQKPIYATVIHDHRLMCQEKDYYNADHVNYLVEHVISQMDCLTKNSSQVSIGDRCNKKKKDRPQPDTVHPDVPW